MGAPVVLHVKMARGVDLVAAVRKADPTGREAMAAAVVGLSTGNLLAVDSRRLAAVAAWPAGTTTAGVAEVARYLSPTTAAPLVFRQSSGLRLGLDLTKAVSPAPALEVSVFDEQHRRGGVLHRRSSASREPPVLHAHGGRLRAAVQAGQPHRQLGASSGVEGHFCHCPDPVRLDGGPAMRGDSRM